MLQSQCVGALLFGWLMFMPTEQTQCTDWYKLAPALTCRPVFCQDEQSNKLAQLCFIWISSKAKMKLFCRAVCDVEEFS